VKVLSVDGGPFLGVSLLSFRIPRCVSDPYLPTQMSMIYCALHQLCPGLPRLSLVRQRLLAIFLPCLKWHSSSLNHLVIILFKDRHRSFLGCHSMDGHNRFCSVIQGRKVAGHSRGFSDLNWHLGVLASSKYQDLSLKFEGWFGMHPLTSAKAKVFSEEGQSMGASLGD